MKGSEFVETTKKIIENVQRLFGVREDALILKTSGKTPKKYRRVIHFDDMNYDLTYKRNCKEEMLLSSFIDVFADLIEENCRFMETSAGYIPLENPSAFSRNESERWTKEIAEELYNNIAFLVFSRFQTGLGINLSLMDELSTRTYEGDDVGGYIVFCIEGPFLQANIVPEFDREIFWDWESLSQIRKLIAGMYKNNALIFMRKEDGRYQFKGYCANFNPSQKNQYKICYIRCRGSGAWTLFYNKKNGNFQRFHSRIQVCNDQQKYAMKKLKKVFPNYVRDKRCANACTLLHMAEKQTHGTALIFLDFENIIVSERMERLQHFQRAVKVHEKEFCAKQYDKFNITRMDGALIINAKTMSIQYIATIVDGRANLPGQLDKGARHNSVRTFLSDLYLESIKTKKPSPSFCAVIFSSDGDMEVVTNEEMANLLCGKTDGCTGEIATGIHDDRC